MLRNTFLHVRGIGPARESSLWQEGIITWLDYSRIRIANRNVCKALELSESRLGAGDAGFFSRALPAGERWRLYADFADCCAFLDIETTGLSSCESVSTVAGILDRNGYRAFVRGVDLDELPQALSSYRMLVTFNGASFDLPFLAAEFGRDTFSGLGHIDLRPVLRRAGYRGGLKRIERVTGLGRDSVLSSLDGYDAVLLWNMADEGEPGALGTLIRYNAEDVASLPALMALAVATLANGTPMANSNPPPFTSFDSSTLDFDQSLVEFLAERKVYRPSRW